jgi:hypothetical protein
MLPYIQQILNMIKLGEKREGDKKSPEANGSGNRNAT